MGIKNGRRNEVFEEVLKCYGSIPKMYLIIVAYQHHLSLSF
jgi:hypothetical protein